jgi:hypothetical protein
MLLFLADSAPTPPAGTSEWLMVLAFLLWMGSSAKNLLRKGGEQQPREIVNNPLKVEKAAQFVTVEDFAALKLKVDNISTKLDADYTALVQAGNERVNKITECIHATKDELSATIITELKQVYTRVNEHETRIAYTEGRLGLQKRPRD